MKMLNYKLIHDETCEIYAYIENFLEDKDSNPACDQIFENLKRFATKMADEGKE